tara:strand:+ start:877 stop:1560 length:684 start_codon:yes stop_codon:yes gene_type:complete
MISSIILCGGKNTRLSSYKKKITKPLIKYKGKTLLEYHLINLEKLDVKKNFINTFKKKRIFNNFKKKKGLNFEIIDEKKLRGTAGVIISNLNNFTDEIMVLYGDNFINFDVKKFYNYFINNDCDLLIGVFKKKDLSISGSVEFTKNNEILVFNEKDPKLKDKSGFCNAGVYLIKKQFLDKFKKNKFLDFGHDIFLKKFLNKKCQIYKIKSCKAFDTIELYNKNLINS